mmetsp:Transcript_14295/g.28530  ORF Transcript_14295/g.28530 Transcript_14295/m.28530 type:complete len:89 (+) Transcript_14295:315-581(+)
MIYFSANLPNSLTHSFGSISIGGPATVAVVTLPASAREEATDDDGRTRLGRGANAEEVQAQNADKTRGVNWTDFILIFVFPFCQMHFG